jgi:putative phage-type endonuclease
MSEFDAERRSGIGGSDAAAAIGISRWRTPYELYLEKIGEAEPVPVTEPMRWGTLLEPVVAAEYSRRTGRQIETPPMLRHPVHEWMIGHIDRRVVGEPRIVEIKTTGIGIGWGEAGTDEIPLTYTCQVHHYLTLTGADVADVAVLIGGQDFRLYEVRRDDAIARELVEREHTFWWHVEHREPPPPVNTRDAVRRWGRLTSAGKVTASQTEEAAIVRLRHIQKTRAELDADEDHYRRTILAALADRGDTLVDLAGNIMATWRLDKGRKAYTVEAREPSRRFLLKD